MRAARVLTALFAVILVIPTGAVVAAAGPSTSHDAPERQRPCPAEMPTDQTDPGEDVLGWEQGVWYNESIGVDQDDGLTDRELNRSVARTMARVEAVRCLEFQQDVDVEVWSRERYSARVNDTRQTTTPAHRTLTNAKYEALFLVNESADAVEIQQQNTHAGTRGIYLPERDRIIIVNDGTTTNLSEPAIAHELVHALQDQHFDTERPTPATIDRINAQDSVIEGDAAFVQNLYLRRCLPDAGKWECLHTHNSNSQPPTTTGPYIIRIFPYVDGRSFVGGVKMLHGWKAVNDLYANPPTSTEQVIHPSHYGADSPSSVELNDSTVGTWERVRPGDHPDHATVGEASLTAMLAYPLYDSSSTNKEPIKSRVWLNLTLEGGISQYDPLNYHTKYTDGWDGDRLHAYQNASDETAYVWRLKWDSQQDTKEFVQGYKMVLNYWGATKVGEHTYRIHPDSGFADTVHIIEDRQNKTVTIVNAPTTAAIDDVYTPANVTHIDHQPIGGNDTEQPTTTPPDNPTDTPDTSGSLNPMLTLAIGVVALVGLVFALRELL